MNMSFTGKRLLLLDGKYCLEEFLDFQRRTGVVYIVTTDLKHRDSPLRTIAQEVYDVSPLDREGLIELIKDKHIDGAFSGTNEDIIPCMIDVAKVCQMPFYASKEQWEAASNKKRFKEQCRKYGIPVVKEYPISDSLTRQELEQIEYPVVLKPVDACSSRGVTLCENQEELIESYFAVKSQSKEGTVIAEQYMDGTEIVAYYTLCDGHISLSSVSDRYNRIEGIGIHPLPDAYQYPSKYTELFIEKYNEPIIEMLRQGLKLKNGVLGIQGFASNGDLAFFEMGYRLGGTSQFRYTYALNGIKNIDMLLTYALSGSMEGDLQYMDNPRFSKPCCTLTLAVRAGTIARIEGIDAINKMEGVLCTELHYRPGDEVKETNTLAQMISWIFLIGDNVPKLKNLIKKVQETIRVLDADGNNMIISAFDPERLDYGRMMG